METHAFQAETQKLLGLMIHSLYSNKEVFLRELVSNASDALDRRRFEGLRSPALQADAELAIELVADRPARTLTITDNGIGMSRAEVIEHLGTIARSGTLEFLKRTSEGGEAAPDLIGQFGVGFYASFMVADEVEVVTRKAGEATATRWISKGAGEYGIEEATRETAGTTIRLHLKAVDGEAGIADFCDEWVLKQVIRKYSDFVAYPIRLTLIESAQDAAARDGSADAAASATDAASASQAGALPSRRTLDAPLNSMKAIWTRPESEVAADDFNAFYKHVTHDPRDPMLRVSTSIEGTFEARALLFVPSQAPYDLYHRERLHNGVQLYVRRVFIMDECRELLPEWLRFVRGVVDAEDLSLNVSREMLQQDRQIQAIRKHLVKKVVERIRKLQQDDREEYEKLWAQFGPVLKEGLLDFSEDREKILDLVLAPSSADDGKLVSLGEYVDRMPADQDVLYYIAGPKLDVLRRSPHLEAFKEKGIEVLFFVDPVDEVWLGQGPVRYREKSWQSIGHREALLGSEDEKEKKKEELERREADLSDLLKALRSAIQDDVKEVRLSGRLKTSAACLVHEEGDLSPALEAMLRQAGQAIPERKPILELNPEHAVVERLQARFAKDPADARIADAARLLFGQAVLAEGGQLEDPSGFAGLVNKLMAETL